MTAVMNASGANLLRGGMNVTLYPGSRHGSVTVPASKSQAHRLLICAALGTAETVIECDGAGRDIEATCRCLSAMGADIRSGASTFTVNPVGKVPDGEALLPCGESGSTLRFLLPAAGALGLRGAFRMEGKLPARPVEDLSRVLRNHGMEIRQEGEFLHFAGVLRPGDYILPGNISSQYISGLLLALPLLAGDSTLHIMGKPESADYIAMTEDALQKGGIRFIRRGQDYVIPGNQRFALPGRNTVERDWSGAAFFLSMGAFSPAGITLRGMDTGSRQGDRRVLDILRDFGAVVTGGPAGLTVRRGTLRGQTIDAAQIPDLVPALSAVAAAAEGETRFVNAARLRFKESDRLAATAAMLRALGADAQETADGLLIRGRKTLSGGTADAAGDHRIAMSAAVAASVCETPVTILGAECTVKSYPRFWEDLDSLEADA